MACRLCKSIISTVFALLGALFIFFALAILPCTSAVHAQGTIVTKPVMRYGFGILTCMAYSSDGRFVASGGYGGVTIWNAETGEVIRNFDTPVPAAIAFSPDGSRILTGAADDSYEAQLWDATTGAKLQTYSGLTDVIYCVAFSSNDRVAAGSADGKVKVWIAPTGTPLCTYSGHTDTVSSLAFSPDGERIVSGGYDGKAKIWYASTGSTIHSLTADKYSTNAVDFSPDGTCILTAGTDHIVKVWDAEGGYQFRSCNGHTGTIYAARFSNDGMKIISGSDDITARIWDTATGFEINAISANDVVFHAFLSPDGEEALLCCGNNTIKSWNIQADSVAREYAGHTYFACSAAISPDGIQVAVGYMNGETKTYDASTGQLIRVFPGDSWVESVAFSPDSTKILTGSDDHAVRLWDTATGDQITTFTGHTGVITDVAYSPNGNQVISASVDKTARLWDIQSGDVVCTYTEKSSINSVAFSPDGTKIVTAGAKAKVWDAGTTELLQAFTGPFRAVAFSPDGKSILTGDSYNTANLWDMESTAPLRTFKGHQNAVTSVCFSPNEAKVLTGSLDKTAKLWDITTSEVLRTFMPPNALMVNSVAYSPDGMNVLTLGMEGNVFLWASGKPHATSARKWELFQ